MQALDNVTKVAKVKGHPSLDMFGETLAENDKFPGKVLADIAAGVAASKAAFPEWAKGHVRKTETCVFAIASRLAYIEAELWDTRPSLVHPPAELPFEAEWSPGFSQSPVTNEAEARGHRLVRAGKWDKCSRCRRERAAGSTSWLSFCVQPLHPCCCERWQEKPPCRL